MLASRNIRNMVTLYFIIFIVFSILKSNSGNIVDNKSYLLLISFSSTIISSLIVYFMFKPSKVKGVDRTYVLRADLGILKEENIQKIEIPAEGVCIFCQKNIYKPFRCANCKELFCGQHSLPSDHNCPKNYY